MKAKGQLDTQQQRMTSIYVDLGSESRISSLSLTPPSSVSPSLTVTSNGTACTQTPTATQNALAAAAANLEDKRALQLALELSMLELAELKSNGCAGGNLNLSEFVPTTDATLNAFTSMLVAAGGGGCLPGSDDRSKKSQNMTECVPVPSSEHVAEIVGRQGESNFSFPLGSLRGWDVDFLLFSAHCVSVCIYRITTEHIAHNVAKEKHKKETEKKRKKNFGLVLR